MVLVHDDDLARIQTDLQPDASALMNCLQVSKPEIERVLYGQCHHMSTLLGFSRLDAPQKIVNQRMEMTVR